MGTGWEVPARVINSLINGPGFYLGRLIPIPIPEALNSALSYDADRLSGIIVFWFLIGLSIDRRRNKQALDRQYPIRAGMLFTFAVIVCGVLGFNRIAYALCPGTKFSMASCPSASVEWGILAKYPLRTWETMNLGLGVWLLALFLYFAKRAFIAAQWSLAKP